MDPRVLVIAAIAAGLWYGGKATAYGVDRAAHRVARALHRKAPAAPPVSAK
jgi:hypothetical protein